MFRKEMAPLLQGPLFALVHVHNHQYKVSTNDVIVTQRLHANIDEKILLKKVLMVGGSHFTAVGRPLLSNIEVTAVVEEQKHMRNKVSLFRTPGRRLGRWVDNAHAATVLRILDIKVLQQPDGEEGFNVVGELNKYYGDPSVVRLGQSNGSSLFVSGGGGEGEGKGGAPLDLQRFTDPVFEQDDGYDNYYKRDWASVEGSKGLNPPK